MQTAFHNSRTMWFWKQFGSSQRSSVINIIQYVFVRVKYVHCVEKLPESINVRVMCLVNIFSYFQKHNNNNNDNITANKQMYHTHSAHFLTVWQFFHWKFNFERFHPFSALPFGGWDNNGIEWVAMINGGGHPICAPIFIIELFKVHKSNRFIKSK